MLAWGLTTARVRLALAVTEKLDLHDLRHVAGNLAMGAGADVKLVLQMLGHQDACETLNTYSARWYDSMDEAARRIE